MRKSIRLAAVAVLGASGCGISGGFLRDAASVQKFDYQMRIQSLRTVRQAEGQSAIGSVFCAIPLSDRLYARAMADLHNHAKLQANEVLANIREDETTTWYLGFFCNHSLTLSADVVLLVPEGGGIPPGFSAPPPPPSLVP